jgi:phage FluMu protein gp41
MAVIDFDLIDGLTLGDGDTAVVHKHVKLRSLTAGDLEDAGLEAEKVLRIDGQPVIVTSPVAMSNAVLKRQILRIGEIAGPLNDVMFRKLSATDLELIQAQAELIDSASRAAVEAALNRGRSDQPVA